MELPPAHRRFKTNRIFIGINVALRRRLGKALVEKIKSGPLLQWILERPFFIQTLEELTCKQELADEFYVSFRKELENPETGVVDIYCPFSSSSRWQLVEPQLQRALKKGVKLTVYTLSPNAYFVRNKKHHAKVIEWLRMNGAEVWEQNFMYEKAIFFDSRLAFVGSSNVFSAFGPPTTDIMLRFEVP